MQVGRQKRGKNVFCNVCVCIPTELPFCMPPLVVLGTIGDIGFPTNIASLHLVTGCPNARAGVEIVKKRTLRAT